MKDKTKLVKKVITNKQGKKQTVWVKMGDAPNQPKGKELKQEADKEKVSRARKVYEKYKNSTDPKEKKQFEEAKKFLDSMKQEEKYKKMAKERDAKREQAGRDLNPKESSSNEGKVPTNLKELKNTLGEIFNKENFDIENYGPNAYSVSPKNLKDGERFLIVGMEQGYGNGGRKITWNWSTDDESEKPLKNMNQLSRIKEELS